MTGMRLLWTLERARLTSDRGRAWLDTLAIFGFAVATAILLLLAGAASLFHSRAQAPKEPITTGLQRLAEASSSSDPQVLDAFLLSYQVITGFAFFITVLPALSLGASAAAVAARSRSQILRHLRLLGLGRFHAQLIILVVVLVQMLLGLGAGTLLYFTSFYLWQMLEFQGSLVSGAEVMIGWSSWLNTALLLVTVTIFATLSSFSSARLSRRRLEAQRWFRLFSPAAIAVGVGAIALATLVGFATSAGAFTWDLTILVAAVVLVVGFLAPAALYLVGTILARRSRVNLLLAGGWLQANARSAALAVAPASLIMFLALTLGARPHDLIAVIAEGDGSVITPAVVPDFLADLLQRDTVIGLLLVCVGVVVVSVVSASLEQATVIINRGPQSETLLMMGLEPRALTQARLCQILLPQLLGFLVAIAMAAVMVLPQQPLTALPWEVAFLLAAVFATTVVVTVVANHWLAPLQTRVVGPDLEQAATF